MTSKIRWAYAPIHPRNLPPLVAFENDSKNFKDIEIVEIGRKHRNQNLFKPEWTCESMGAVKRTNLEITLSKCELKTDELGTD